MKIPVHVVGSRKRGRPGKLSESSQLELVRRYQETDDSPKAIAETYAISKTALYNILARHGVGRKQAS